MERRYDGTVRPDWKQTVTDQGMTYWPTILPDGAVRSYWREGPHYVFSDAEIDQMHQDAQTLMNMFVMAGDYILAHPEIMDKMCIPESARARIRESWDRFDANGDEIEWGSIYGRIDVVYGGNRFLDMTSRDNYDFFDEKYGRIRLYEFNADTPTSLLEAAIIQWRWFEETKQGNDQWNNVYEMLVEAWRRNLSHVEAELGYKPKVYFTCTWDDNLLADLEQLHPDHGKVDLELGSCSYEDLQNMRVLMEACKEAGYETDWRYIQEVHLGEDGRFYDGRHPGTDKPHLDVVFKLYPWEFMTSEEFGMALIEDTANFGKRTANGKMESVGTLWIEPPYKMLWSNKGILPVLWMLFGDDPERSQLLIPAYFEGEQPESLKSFIRKPIFGREGASVQIVENGVVTLETPGDYGREGYIVQEYVPPPAFPGYDDQNYPTLGIWYVDGEPAGLGIREAEGVIADNLSYFAPHVIRNNPV
jgi:glutathionylspermidine synthase